MERLTLILLIWNMPLALAAITLAPALISKRYRCYILKVLVG